MPNNKVIITSPSLDVSKNVSGISAVTRLMMENCSEVDWVHFEIRKKDKERMQHLSNLEEEKHI